MTLSVRPGTGLPTGIALLLPSHDVRALSFKCSAPAQVSSLTLNSLYTMASQLCLPMCIESVQLSTVSVHTAPYITYPPGEHKSVEIVGGVTQAVSTLSVPHRNPWVEEPQSCGPKA